MSELNEFLKGVGLPAFNSMRESIVETDPVTEEQWKYKIDDQWFLPRSDIERSRMFYVIERFQTDEGERIRIGYYIIGKKGRFKSKWAWGQYCPWYRPSDLANIMPLLKVLARSED